MIGTPSPNSNQVAIQPLDYHFSLSTINYNEIKQVRPANIIFSAQKVIKSSIPFLAEWDSRWLKNIPFAKMYLHKMIGWLTTLPENFWRQFGNIENWAHGHMV